MDKCLWVCAGYPMLIGAIGVLWTAYQRALKDKKQPEVLLLEEKDRRIRELEAFQKIIEDRLKGGSYGRKPL